MHRPKQSIESCPGVIKACILLLFLCAIAAAQETAPISALEVKYRKQIFKDAKFSVYLLEIPPNHASLMHRHATDMLSIFVSGGETKSTIYGKPPKEDRFVVGEVRFRSVGFTHSTENIGANMFRSVILEFNSSMGLIQPTKPGDSHDCNPALKTACVEDKYLFCTPGFCVEELRIAPGATWRNGSYQSDQMLIAVSDYELLGQPQGKATHTLKRKSGEVEYFPRGASRQWGNATGETASIINVIFR